MVTKRELEQLQKEEDKAKEVEIERTEQYDEARLPEIRDTREVRSEDYTDEELRDVNRRLGGTEGSPSIITGEERIEDLRARRLESFFFRRDVNRLIRSNNTIQDMLNRLSVLENRE